MLIVEIVSDFLDINGSNGGTERRSESERERDQTVCTFVNMINDPIVITINSMLTSTLDIDRRQRVFALGFHSNTQCCVCVCVCIKLICRMTIQLLCQLIILA